VPVGQLSDPYQQGEDELGITISGLPGQLDDLVGPPPDAEPSDAPVDGEDEVVAFDLDEWSDMERGAVTDRLREAGIPHGWEGTSLHVAATDEAPVANVLEIVDGEARPALDDEHDQVAYDLSEWDDDPVTALERELQSAGIDYEWDGDELYVYARDEEAVDDLVDRVAHPHQLVAEPDDGPAGAELLGDLFVAADRLRRDGEDPDGTLTVLELGQSIGGSEPPYGLGEREWEHLCERVTALGDELLADDVDPDAVKATARELRTALRPFV
jgi:hypothetical protein